MNPLRDSLMEAVTKTPRHLGPTSMSYILLDIFWSQLTDIALSLSLHTLPRFTLKIYSELNDLLCFMGCCQCPAILFHTCLLGKSRHKKYVRDEESCKQLEKSDRLRELDDAKSKVTCLICLQYSVSLIRFMSGRSCSKSSVINRGVGK